MVQQTETSRVDNKEAGQFGGAVALAALGFGYQFGVGCGVGVFSALIAALILADRVAKTIAASK